MVKHATWAAWVMAVGALSGCEPKASQVSIQLVTNACSTPQPFDGVTHVRVLVTGEGMKTVDRTTTVNKRTLDVPEIPVGKARRVEVRGYVKDPAEGGAVFSVGRSKVFDVSNVATKKGESVPTLRVVMRPVNVFSLPTVVASPSTCAKLTAARAMATASRVESGQVFIVGGYGTDENGKRTMLASTEIFDPLEGTFTASKPLPGTDGARAFHTAVAVPGDAVFVAGGEALAPDGGALVRDNGAVFHLDGGRYDLVDLTAPRTRHAVGQAKNGDALLVGGVSATGTAVDVLEWYQVSGGFMQGMDATFAVVDGAVAGLGDGSGVVVAGGRASPDAGIPSATAAFFRYDQGAFQPPVTTSLTTARFGASLVPFQDATHVLVVGGFIGATEEDAQALGTTELIAVSGGALSKSEGPAVGPRANACAVALSSAQALVTGGFNTDLGAPAADASADLVVVGTTGSISSLGMPPMSPPRYGHACVTLEDGSALLVGGADNSSGKEVALSQALIFMPAPRDD